MGSIWSMVRMGLRDEQSRWMEFASGWISSSMSRHRASITSNWSRAGMTDGMGLSVNGRSPDRSNVVGRNGILPRGDAGNIIDVVGTQIRIIGGCVVDGIVEISSASRLGLP